MKKNIVLTSAGSYEYWHLRPIIETYENHKSNDEFVLFLSDSSKETISKLKRHKIKIIEFISKYPYFTSNLELTKYLPDHKENPTHPKLTRYYMYEAYLKSCSEEYDNVLLCDSRDVIFQKNPFDFAIQKGLYVFLEDDSESIGDNYFNSLWIKSAFGEVFFEKVKHQPIACSGVSIGDSKSIISYLEIMNEIIGTELTGKNCKDQGTHNYILNSNFIPEAIKISDDVGPVSTISSFKSYDKIRINADAKVINWSNQIVNIVHQYDRHWGLLWKYNKRAFINKKINYCKQFLLAIKKNKKISRLYLSNLKSIFLDPMVKKYDW